MTNSFWREDLGQDFTEYALLLAFICVTSVALFLTSGGSFTTIWGATNNLVSQANSVATSGS